MTAIERWVTSIPTQRRPSFCAATTAVPQPQNGSSTTSPGLEESAGMRSNRVTTHEVVTRICRFELIVVHDIGQLPAGQDEAEALYRLVDVAYERRSLVLASNLHPAAFDTILPKGLATATVDRLLHHAHVIVTDGRSQRLEDALSGRGVAPLPSSSATGPTTQSEPASRPRRHPSRPEARG